MAATPRRGTPAPAPPATAGPTSLSPSEAQAVTEQAADLAQAGQFSQATDILTAAIGRCAADDTLADELRFSLANVLFLAGSYRRALTEFETAGARLAERYGAADAASTGMPLLRGDLPGRPRRKHAGARRVPRLPRRLVTGSGRS